MIEHPIAMGVGIGIGIAIGTAAVYFLYQHHTRYKNNTQENGKYRSSKQNQELEEKRQLFSQMVQAKCQIDTLSIKDLTNWFRENRSKYLISPKMIIAVPTESQLKGLGYFGVKLDPKKNILQFFYDSSKNKVLQIRVVEYNNIESNLEAQLIEQDGMIVITD